MQKIELNLNALLVFVLSAILLGAFGIQIFEKETPCPLCLLQRIGMIGVGMGALLNLKFGIRKSHYAVSLISALFGSSVALRQIALHICPEFPLFGKPFWGLSLYTWSFLIFASSIAYIALLFLIFPHTEGKKEKLTPLGYSAFALLFLLAISNTLYTLFLCGLGVCEG